MFKSISLFGITISLYDPINYIAYLAVLIWVLFNLKKYREFCTLPVIVDKKYFKKVASNNSRVGVIAFFEAVLIFAIAIVVVSPLNNPLSLLFLGDKSDGFFPIIFFCPIALFALGVIFRITPLRLLDYSAPADCLLLIIVKIACYCEGCCNGIELASSPFFNHMTNRYELPIQLIEIACAVIMFIVLSIMLKKKKKAGFLYPAFITMYSGSRFISEFWRDDYAGIYGRLNGNHIMCLIGFTLGVVYLIVVSIWGTRITAFFDKKNQVFLEKKTADLKKSKNIHNKRKNKKKK